jgi:hypothetical protein
MINILEQVGFLATIAALRAASHCLHHGQVELGRSVGCTTVTRFTAAEVEVEVVVVEAGGAHIDVDDSGCYRLWVRGLVVDGVDVAAGCGIRVGVGRL